MNENSDPVAPILIEKNIKKKNESDKMFWLSIVATLKRFPAKQK